MVRLVLDTELVRVIGGAVAPPPPREAQTFVDDGNIVRPM
jgi:hypothetical protein